LERVYPRPAIFTSLIPEAHAERLQTLQTLLQADRQHVQVFVSHAGYGVQNYLPDTRRLVYFTMLREPIDRVVSGYYMYQRKGQIPPDMTLEEFCVSHRKPGSNLQTSFLSGYFLERHLDGKEPDPAAFNREMLNLAKENLRRHVVVGLTERFDESLLLVQEAFGWPTFRMLHARANVGRNRVAMKQLSAETLAFVSSQNELDLELYAFAKQLFEEQLLASEGRIGQKAASFRRLNAAYGHAFPLLKNLAGPIRKILKWPSSKE